MEAIAISPLEQIAQEFNRGERARNPEVLLGLMNQYYIAYGKSPLTHLDDVNNAHTTGGLSSILGFGHGNPKKMQKRLVEFSVFSPRVADYSTEIQGQIIGGIIKNVSKGGFSSFYLSKENPNEEENRRLIGASQQMKDYLLSIGVHHLDDLRSKHATDGLGSILGFNPGNTNKMRQRLIEFEIFSQRLVDYSPQVLEDMIKIIIQNISKRSPKPPYFFEENKYLEENRRVVATSKQMKDYLLSIGVHHLDDITYRHATDGLGSILGFRPGNPKKMQKRLVEFSVFSQRVADYSPEVSDRIINNAIGNISSNGFSSFYLSKDNTYAEENRVRIGASQQMRGYLLRMGISHLDDVVGRKATWGIGSLLGFKAWHPIEMKRRLAEFGVFSTDLSDPSYDSIRERICENLINKTGSYGYGFSSFYTSIYLDPNVLESNRRAILASKAVQDFFREQGYNMNDPSTMTRDVELFLNKYFGTKNIEDVLKPQERSEIPRYRVIQKEWNPEEEKIFQDAYERFGRDESNFMIMLNLNKENLQELFGVSYSAIMQKCKYMGLISSIELGGTRESGTPKYAFPSIHAEEFPDFVKGFENYAALLERNIIPAVTPVFAFESAAHEQFYHVTLPVHYKGVDIGGYNPYEQAIISAAWHYISDNAGFGRKQNGDIIIDPATEQGLEPAILQIQGTHDKNLTQLIFRRKFNPDNDARMTAIELAGIRPKSEIYLFKHETHPTYQNTRV